MLALAVWMIVRVHRQLQSRGGRWLLYPVIAVLALASIGGGYETLGEAADAKAYPMPGRLIDVGGHSLHLSCTGSGTPTVVLEPGAGGMSSILGWIAPAVARDTRVCVYDRAGRGWSEPADSAQDGAQIAADLHTLLQRGHVPGPYVLAGHSFGGLYVLTFAARYPDEVAGMVLVDSTAPASAANPGTPSPGHEGSSTSHAPCLGTGFGLRLDWVSPACTPGSTSSSLPPPSRDEVRASDATASTLRTSTSTSSGRPRPGKALGDFADKPLIVLTAGNPDMMPPGPRRRNAWRVVDQPCIRIVGGATHEDLIADEEDAAATRKRSSTWSHRSGAQGAWSADPEPQQSAWRATSPVVGGLDDAEDCGASDAARSWPATSACGSRRRPAHALLQTALDTYRREHHTPPA